MIKTVRVGAGTGTLLRRRGSLIWKQVLLMWVLDLWQKAALKNSRAKGSHPHQQCWVDGYKYKQQQQDESRSLPHTEQKKQFQVDYHSENESWGTSMVVQWLRLQVPHAGDPGVIPGQGTRSPMLQLRPSHIQINKINIFKKKSVTINITEDNRACLHKQEV